MGLAPTSANIGYKSQNLFGDSFCSLDGSALHISVSVHRHKDLSSYLPPQTLTPCNTPDPNPNSGNPGKIFWLESRGLSRHAVSRNRGDGRSIVESINSQLMAIARFWEFDSRRERGRPQRGPNGTTGMFSQLHTSIMKPSGSWKKSCCTSIPSSTTHRLTFSMPSSLRRRSTSPRSSDWFKEAGRMSENVKADLKGDCS